MLDINDHHDDPMLKGFCERRDKGEASPHDRANAALRTADLAALAVAEQGDDLDRVQAEAIMERVALAASATAKAERIGEVDMAERFAQTAESEVLDLSAFPFVNVDGIKRLEVFN